MAKATTPDTTIAKLKAENKRLKHENAELNAKVTETSKQTVGKKRHFWKTVAMVLCIGFAMALLVVGNIIFWTGRTLTNTDKFVSTVQPVLKEPEVQSAVATYTTDKLFANVDIQTTLEEALPPKADFLAPTLATKVQDYTQSTLQKVIASDQFQSFWINTLSKRHARFIKTVKNYEGDGTIRLNDVYQHVSEQLQGTKLAFLANKKLPPNIGNITLVQADWLPTAHNIVVNLSLYRWLTISLFLLLVGLAVYISNRRRRTIITIGVFSAFMMLASLISLRIAISLITNSAAAQYQSAVRITATTLANPLILQTRAIMLLGVVAAIIAWISGPYKAATVARERVNLLFQGKLHHALFSKGENGLSRFIVRYRNLLLWAAVGLFAFIMLVVSLSPTVLLWASIALILFVLLVFLLAAEEPATGKKKRT